MLKIIVFVGCVNKLKFFNLGFSQHNFHYEKNVMMISITFLQFMWYTVQNVSKFLMYDQICIQTNANFFSASSHPYWFNLMVIFIFVVELFSEWQHITLYNGSRDVVRITAGTFCRYLLSQFTSMWLCLRRYVCYTWQQRSSPRGPHQKPVFEWLLGNSNAQGFFFCLLGDFDLYFELSLPYSAYASMFLTVMNKTNK